MSSEAQEVLGTSLTRYRGRVHLLVRTAAGAATLIFSESLAAQVGRDLARHAVPVVGERRNLATAAAQGEPLRRPSGKL